MAQLVWDQVGERRFETGITKCVLYKTDGYGVPWNGLTSIEEDVSMDVDPVHFDGVKFNDIVTRGDFSASLKAYTYPDEFLFYEGVLEEQSGFYITNQPPSQFGLSYQTSVGDDLKGINAGYKIHLLYNLTAVPSKRTYETLGLDLDPMEFEWNIESIPEEIENFLPTSHVIFDSRKIDPMLLADIESIIYGDEENDARLPPLKGLATFIRNWDRLVITDHGDGTWTADSKVEDQIIMLNSYSFQIETDTAEYIDQYTYTIESSEKNEDDIWQP